ncbi:MAG: hypothetical protein AB8B57_17625 [Congregibacter sp.]
MRQGATRLTLEQQSEVFKERVTVITADLGFKSTIATGERDTILSALANQAQKLNADLALFVQSDGVTSIGTVPIGRLPLTLEHRVLTGAIEGAKQRQ